MKQPMLYQTATGEILYIPVPTLADTELAAALAEFRRKTLKAPSEDDDSQEAADFDASLEDDARKIVTELFKDELSSIGLSDPVRIVVAMINGSVRPENAPTEAVIKAIREAGGEAGNDLPD